MGSVAMVSLTAQSPLSASQGVPRANRLPGS